MMMMMIIIIIIIVINLSDFYRHFCKATALLHLRIVFTVAGGHCEG